MKTKSTGPLLKRVLTKNMSPLEIERIRNLLCYMQRFHRLRFGETIPQEYLDATRSLESLMPLEFRQDIYLGYGLQTLSSCEFVSDIITSILPTAARKTTSATVRSELQRIIDSKMYDLPDLSDISSTTSSASNPQEVPDYSDEGEPHAKKSREE